MRGGNDFGWYVFMQLALFFAYYGLHYDLPLIVLWFPTLILAAFLLIVLVVVAVVFIIEVVRA